MMNIKMRFLTALFLMFLLLTAASLNAETLTFRQYDIITSKNFMLQEKLLKNAVELMKKALTDKQGAKDAALAELDGLKQQVTRHNGELRAIAAPEFLSKMQETNINVSDNYVKIFNMIAGMIKENNLEYAADYINASKKQEEITRLLYHSKIKKISIMLECLESGKIAYGSPREKLFYGYCGEVLKTQADFAKVIFDVDLYSLQCMRVEIEKYELRTALQDCIEKTRQILINCLSIQTDEELKGMNKTLYDAYAEYYSALKAYANYLAGTGKDMKGVEINTNRSNELFEEFESQRIQYLEKS